MQMLLPDHYIFLVTPFNVGYFGCNTLTELVIMAAKPDLVS